jgi:hypothetical protein
VGFCAGNSNRIRGTTLTNKEFMKPTPQISSERRESFPFTDYHYQSTLDVPGVGAREKRAAHRQHGFWRLGAQFHGMETAFSDAADFLVFTLMGLACAWPFYSVGLAIIHVFYG